MAAAEAEAANNAEEENAGEAMDVDQPRENVHIQPVGQSPKQGQAAQTTSTNPQIEPKSVAPPPPSSHGFTAAPQTPSQTLAQSSQPSNSSSATKKSESGRPSITSEIMRKQREAMAQQAEKEKEREEQPETRNDGNKEGEQLSMTRFVFVKLISNRNSVSNDFY